MVANNSDKYVECTSTKVDAEEESQQLKFRPELSVLRRDATDEALVIELLVGLREGW